MTFKRLLADAEPRVAARAALVMANALINEETVSDMNRELARQLLALDVNDLAERIARARR